MRSKKQKFIKKTLKDLSNSDLRYASKDVLEFLERGGAIHQYPAEEYEIKIIVR